MPTREHSADFAFLPNAVCWHPPIRHRPVRHRQAESYWQRGLTPFAFYVLGGVLIAARAGLAPERHKRAMAKGAGAIRKEVKTSRRFFDSKEFADAYGYRAPPKGRAIKRVGSVAYRHAMKAARRRAPEQVTVEITARRLLRLSGLAIDSENYAAVEPTLRRLCRPVGAGGCEMPAALRDFETTPGGLLRLVVDGAWLPADKFARVIWPPPKRSPAALALYLLAHVMDTRPTNRTEVTADSFAKWLGIDSDQAAGRRSEVISRAFAGVNAHLRDLPDDAVKRLWEMKPRVQVPKEYTCEAITDGKIRVVAVARPKVYDAKTAEPRPVGKKRAVERKFLKRAGVGVLRSGGRKSVGVLRSEQGKVWGSCDPGVGVLRSANQEGTQGPQGFSAEFRALYKKDMQERMSIEED